MLPLKADAPENMYDMLRTRLMSHARSWLKLVASRKQYCVHSTRAVFQPPIGRLKAVAFEKTDDSDVTCPDSRGHLQVANVKSTPLKHLRAVSGLGLLLELIPRLGQRGILEERRAMKQGSVV